ncbi:MAG: hypothetical protein M1814_005048 [Vezdaea aestivalis]|nr:MAG: hypothetical protein M1814_005048 [Vezdaea aestivalis]
MAAKRNALAVPSAAALQDAFRLPASSPVVQKALGKLSRPALVNLALNWVDSEDTTLCAPLLKRQDEDELDNDGIYPLESDLDEVRNAYEDLQRRKGAKSDVVDRILEGDWRHGLTLFQLAVVDIHYLLDHPTSQRWSSLRLRRSQDANDGNEKTLNTLPRCHGPTFIRNLQREVSSLVKAHYYFTRHRDYALSMLRIQMYDFPYTSQTSSQVGTFQTEIDSDPVKTIYVAFPDGSASVFISLATSTTRSAPGEGQKLRRIVLSVSHELHCLSNHCLLAKALPKALSKSNERYTLESSKLSARSLSALLALQGGGRENAAAGGWSIFALGTVEDSPLQIIVPELKKSIQELQEKENKVNNTPLPMHQSLQMSREKRQSLVADGRFGASAIEGDGKGIERLDIRMEEKFSKDDTSERVQRPSDTDRPEKKQKKDGEFDILDDFNHIQDDEPDDMWRPEIKLAFTGTHVFAGIRRLVEMGAVSGERMPGWMTGEAGVTVAAVKNGRVRGA